MLQEKESLAKSINDSLSRDVKLYSKVDNGNGTLLTENSSKKQHSDYFPLLGKMEILDGLDKKLLELENKEQQLENDIKICYGIMYCFL